MKPTFKAGDAVKIISLKQRGTVCSISQNGSVKVAVGPLTVRCKISDLEILPAGNSKFKKPQTLGFTAKTKQPASLDLHGYNSNSAREALIQFISDSILAGHAEVDVIHGHGTGIIRNMVHKVLSEI